MKYLKFFDSNLVTFDQNLPKIERTKRLSEEEFLEILNTKCKNFSFMNDQLWRGKPKKSDLELFEPNYHLLSFLTILKMILNTQLLEKNH